jgi:hypothetical protein
MNDVHTFRSAREAKEFLVSRIVEEAQREGIALSEVERKMLYFSETNWTLPDIDTVSDEFDRDYDQDDYEKKIAHLVKGAYTRDLRDSGDEYPKWWPAIRLLSKQDHYILVMIRQAGLRPRGDQLKLLGAGMVVASLFVCLMFAGIYLENRYKVDFGKYIPSRDTRDFLAWAIPASVVVAYCSLRWLLGEQRVDDFVAKSLAGLGRTFNRSR